MRNIYIIIACLLSISLLRAQEFDAVKNLTPAAPEAAQFQKYGDIPVSYYTGTPNISIPLYTIQEYDISVPIGLSYHASGVKLTEMASWVGTGWSLSAGGMLSRSVRGRPDFVNHMDESIAGTYFDNTSHYPLPASLTSADYSFVADVATQQRDSQPDEYYINFLGRSVKFYINQAKEVIVDPSSKVKVARPTSANPFWVVTDASGMKYTFGDTTSAREITKHRMPSVSGGYIEQDYVSAWHLTKIESPTNHAVTFDYEIASDTTHLPTQRHHGNFTLITGVVTEPCANIPGSDGTGNVRRGSTGLPYNFKPVRLKQINYERGGEDYSVEFVSNNSREDAYDTQEQEYLEYYKLNFLHIKQGVNKRLSYIFNFDNLANGLWLTSLNRVSYTHGDFEGGIEEIHSFEYHNHASLPAAKSYDMDYWGLYNGAGNSASSNLIPYSPNYTIGADRDYNFTYAQYGMLTKITYPTGGYNEFEYEPHTVAPNNEVVGGLRIKNITTSTQGGPGSDPDMIREFVYKSPGSSETSGTRSAPFGNSYQTRIYYQCTDEFGKVFYFEVDNLTAYSSHSVNGRGFMSIGYSAVQELIGAGGANGRNVYEFTHVSSPFYETGYEPQGYEEMFSPIYFKSLTNGRMTRQLTQKKISSGYETMKEVLNTYDTIINTSDYIPGIAISLVVDGSVNTTLNMALNQVKPAKDGGIFSDVVSYLPYRLKPDWVRLSQTVEKVYEDGINPIIKTTDYTKSTYGDRWYHDFTTSTKLTYGVSGDIETTSVIYPFNAPSSAAHTALINKYIMAPLSSTSIKGTLPINQSVVLGGSKTTYNVETITGGTVPLPSQQYGLTQGTYHLTNADGGGQEVLLGKFVTYNSNGLPTEVEDATGHKTGLVWHNDLLLATCANAAADEFYYEGYEYDTTASTGSAHTGYRYRQDTATTINFSPPNSRKYLISYWYLSGSTWTYKEEAYSGSGMKLSDGTAIDDIRVYPVDALMTTYTHDTFYGLTSQAGPDNRPMYYIYDAAGRLKLLKDQDGNIVQAYDHKFLAAITD